MKAVLLGATGFLGSWVARALLADGALLTCVVRPGSTPWRLPAHPRLALVRADTADWPAEIARIAADVVISLDWAGVAAAGRDDSDVQAGNVSRLAAVSGAAYAVGARLVIGVGSQAEFGPVDGPVDELRAPAPTTEYGRAKVAAREALQDAAAGADWVWARVFSVFGPLETGPWLLPSVTQAVRSGQHIPLSSGMQPWSYLYAPDAASAFLKLATDPRAHGDINVGHPDAPPLRESLLAFARALDGERFLDFGPTTGAGLQPDVRRLTALGWRPETESSTALARTAQWLSGAEVVDPFLGGALPRPA